MSGGVGEFLMRKMGWRTGEGLGRNREGTVEPIVIDFKVDRKGVNQHLTSSTQLGLFRHATLGGEGVYRFLFYNMK